MFTFLSQVESAVGNVNNVLKSSLKGQSQTKWTSKATPTKAFYPQITGVCKLLKGVVENVSENAKFFSLSTDFYMR
jgi:hypothetical protein